MPSISEPLPERDDDRSRSEHLDEEVPLPLVLEAVCGDCGTTTRLGHPRGIGGADAPGWTCAVCLSPILFSTPSWAWTDRRPTTYNSRPEMPSPEPGDRP